MRLISILLLPFSAVYYAITYIRNKAFDWGIIRSHSFTIPIITVGNITVGGTGKTPHVHYICKFLEDQHIRITILSRGYKRNTQGFIRATKLSSAQEIGDEPHLLYNSLQSTEVAVCEKRVLGVQQITESIKTQAIVLDDAFQHRYLRSSHSIVLIDYNRPLWADFVFPSGRMREGQYALRRANSIIVSKCPPTMPAEEITKWKIKLARHTNIPIYFTTIIYGEPYSAHTNLRIAIQELCSAHPIVLLTGIAQDKPIKDYVEKYASHLTHLSYTDHHHYTQKDIDTITQLVLQTKAKIITTEKDFTKLSTLLQAIQSSLYVLPICIEFVCNGKESFHKEILKIVKS